MDQVTVGIEPLAVEVNQGLVKPVTIILVVLVVLIIVGLILVILLINEKTTPTYKAPKPKTFPSQNIGIQDNPGASKNGIFQYQQNGQGFTDQVTCQGVSTAVWNANIPPVGVCQCITPYWGLRCERETYDFNYFAIGQPLPGDVIVNEIGSFYTNNLSFDVKGNPDPMSCTGRCDSNPECSGIEWSNIDKKCTLLRNSVTFAPGKNVVFDPNVDSTLYLKGRNNKPVITDRVFLFTDGFLPERYWLVTRSTNFINLKQGEQYTIDFTPDSYINDGLFFGIFSPGPIPKKDYTQIIIDGTNDRYRVVAPNEQLTIPLKWQGLELNTVYTRPVISNV